MAVPCLVSTTNSGWGSITTKVAPLPRTASNSASGPAFIVVKKAGPALSRAVSGKQDTAITMSAPIARSAFSMLRTPPSMYLSPFIVIGGQIQGEAVLAAITRSNRALESASHTWSCPVRAFTVVTRNARGRPTSCGLKRETGNINDELPPRHPPAADEKTRHHLRRGPSGWQTRTCLLSGGRRRRLILFGVSLS